MVVSPEKPEADSGRPSTVRYGVLGFASVLSMITYLDRVSIASAAPFIVRELDLTSVADLRWAFTAFAFAYAIFEVPSGWLGDVFGPRLALIRIVIWWSLFTALTAMVGLSWGGFTLGLGFLITARLLFGMGEAGAYPNITRALHNWFPLEQRGIAQGTVWFSGKLMGGLTPLLWAVLVAGISLPWLRTEPLVTWRSSFVIFGMAGVVWCLFFALWFRNRPEEKPAVNRAELAFIRTGGAESHHAPKSVPWSRILSSGNLWFLCLMYGCQAYGWYFNITYLPEFLEQQYAVPPSSVVGAVYKGGPLWMGAIGSLMGGFLTDWFIRRTGNRRLGRRVAGFLGHGICMLCFLLCPLAPTAFWFFLAASLAAFCTDLTVASAWAICQDIGRRYAAIVGGVMNTVAGLSGALAGWLTGTILQSSLSRYAAEVGLPSAQLSSVQKAAGLLHGYHLNFLIFAAAYLVALLCWFRIDSTRPLLPE
jgi:ACS family glucarate transporter-like MFS transporter